MAGFVQNIIWNSVGGFVEAGKKTAGGFAGNALIKAGDMVENSGRSLGNGIERRASNYGTTISGQGHESAAKASPSTAQRPAAKRAVSSPAIGSAKSTPARSNGARGYPSSKQSSTVTHAGQYPMSTSRQPMSNKGSFQTPTQPKSSPSIKPYGQSTGYPSSKKTAVRPGQIKPFTPPVEKKPAGGKVYPGTSTVIGRGGTTAVQSKAYKPMPNAGPQVGKGKYEQFRV